ncbi:MAG: LLM class flavin-dependent oxidoreductase [Gammaproteobacteria bacterium]
MTSDRKPIVGASIRAPYADLGGSIRLIEELGFDHLSVGEHVMFHGVMANSMVVLSYAAAITTRIKLLSSVALVPLYPAALLAKMTSMIDVVSNGRYGLGVGIGGEFKTEFDACGVPVHERGARTDEALEIIRKLWTGETVSHEGRFVKFQDGRIQPPPVQRPGPPIWVAGRKDAAIRRAARFGDVWYPYMYTPEKIAESIVKLRQFEAGFGRAPGSVDVRAHCFINADPDANAARAAVARFVGGTYQQDFTGTTGRYLVAGTPQDCVRRLQEYIDAGATGVTLVQACAPEDFDTMIRRLAAEVVPGLRCR